MGGVGVHQRSNIQPTNCHIHKTKAQMISILQTILTFHQHARASCQGFSCFQYFSQRSLCLGFTHNSYFHLSWSPLDFFQACYQLWLHQTSNIMKWFPSQIKQPIFLHLFMNCLGCKVVFPWPSFTTLSKPNLGNSQVSTCSTND